MRDADWQADLARYQKRPWLKEESIWAIAVYRFGRRNELRGPASCDRSAIGSTGSLFASSRH